jgi:Uma2 family endonuclease
MTTLATRLTFTEFLEQLPEQESDYELVEGVPMRKLATRRHESIAETLTDILKAEARRTQLNLFISGRIVIRTETSNGTEQGRHPDITVVDQAVWDAQPLAYSALVTPPLLTVEVVSSNWEDDYIDKLAEYQKLGIQEYWIVDYLALGSRTYLGIPKEPAILIFTLNTDGQYDYQRYRHGDRLLSSIFPQLDLQPETIWQHYQLDLL